MPDTDRDKSAKVQGEGDYESARRFDADERSFIQKGGVERKAREAEEALDGAEGAELEKARRETAKGRPGGSAVAGEGQDDSPTG